MPPKQGQRSITSFFASKAPKRKDTSERDGGEPEAAQPPAKRRQPAKQEGPSGSDAAAAAPRAAPPPPQSPQPEARSSEPSPDAAAAAALPSQRDQRRRARAQAKLVGSGPSLADPGRLGASSNGMGPGGGGGGGGRPKYTPLEEQVVALRRANPGVLLVVEVGYKFRFFGEDAEAASRVLGLHAYPDHSFLTASIPVQRLPVHVRRLVQAGYKVGVCRQTETAALKAASSNRSAPFERRLTALYTAATLDAGERADKIGEEGAIEESQGLDALMPRASGGSYLMVVAEGPADDAQPGGALRRPQPGQGGMGVGAEEEGPGSDVEEAASAKAAGAHRRGARAVGVVAVDAASGDVVWGQVSAGGVQSGLEAALLSLAPSEVLALEPLGPDTLRLLERFAGQAPGGGGGGGGRGGGGGGGCGGGGARVARLVRLPGGSYLSNAALGRLSEFYAPEPEEAGAQEGEAGAARATGAPAEGEGATPPAAPAALGAGGQPAAGAGGGGQHDALGFVLSLPPLVLQALSAAVEYLGEFGLAGVLRDARGFRPLAGAAGLELSSNAMQQLELMATGEGSFKGSLLHLMDRTATGFGSRLMRRWLAAPLADRGLILQRLDAVEELVAAQSTALASLPAELRRLPDLERAFTRCAHGTASPAEAVAALKALQQLPERLGIRIPQQQPGHPPPADAAEAAVASAASAPLLVRLLADACSPAASGAAAASLAVLDEAAARSNDFLKIFRSRARFPEVFERAEAVAEAEAHLQGLLPQLARAAGVPASKMRYVSIQNQGDYLVELPAEREAVPGGWQKVCATKKVSRWHAPEVLAGMARLAVAQETRAAACRAAWASFLSEFARHRHAACRAAVAALAHLDALCALAALAASPGYCRPAFADDGAAPRLVVRRGRHPTLDLALQGGAVPNDVELRWDGTRGAIVTGPNMGGKSVYLRMAASLAVMAHIGSYVPAESLELGVMDAILTRMGAADDLSSGRSTFQEEMANAAEMLARATPRSLVILDELGRGTATRDGIAVASATLEHLLEARQCLTLFTTHYPEIWRALERGGGVGGSSEDGGGGGVGPGSEAARRVGVWHMAYQVVAADGEAAAAGAGGNGCGSGSDSGDEGSGMAAGEEGSGGRTSLVFLYTIRPGGAGRSFGLNVARMAGLPAPVVSRAAEVARGLQRQEQTGTRLLAGNSLTNGSGGDAGGSSSSAEAVLDAAREVALHLKAVGTGGAAQSPGAGEAGEGSSSGTWPEALQATARQALE